MVTAIIWEGVLCNLFHSTGRISVPKHLHDLNNYMYRLYIPKTRTRL